MASTYKQSFKQNYTDNVDISIYNCGLQSCEPGYTWGPGARDHYLIHLIAAGKGTYTLNGKVYELGPGDIFPVGISLGWLQRRLCQPAGAAASFSGGYARAPLQAAG